MTRGRCRGVLSALLAAALGGGLGPIPANGAAPAQGVLAGDWVFDHQPDYPGVRMVQVRHDGTGWTGILTTTWYGPEPFTATMANDGTLGFDVGNGNPALPPRPWTARLVGNRIELRGRIWDTTVDGFGRRGTPDTMRTHGFPLAALPPMRVLPSNGLALVPPMGWSSWNRFADHIDDRTVRQVADALVASGLRDAGYHFVNIDDGWQGDRDASGTIRPNARFPDMRALADYLHARGLKLGLYSSPGPKTCAGYTGSYGHVAQDARTYAAWGVDYLKYDLCSGEAFYRDRGAIEQAYDAMGQALRATGRPIVFSLCEYGRDAVGQWGRQVGGNLWRTSGDITDDYSSMAANGFDHRGDHGDSGPGGWNDPDMLEIGNGGLGPAAERTHLALWAMDAAPLMLGNDPRHMSDATRRLLEDRAVLAIDQDPAGISGRRVRRDGPIEVLRKPLADGSVIVGIFNRGQRPTAATLMPGDSGLPHPCDVRNVWTGAAVGPADRMIRIGAEGVELFHIS